MAVKRAARRVTWEDSRSEAAVAAEAAAAAPAPASSCGGPYSWAAQGPSSGQCAGESGGHRKSWKYGYQQQQCYSHYIIVIILLLYCYYRYYVIIIAILLLLFYYYSIVFIIIIIIIIIIKGHSLRRACLQPATNTQNSKPRPPITNARSKGKLENKLNTA